MAALGAALNPAAQGNSSPFLDMQLGGGAEQQPQPNAKMLPEDYGFRALGSLLTATDGQPTALFRVAQGFFVLVTVSDFLPPLPAPSVVPRQEWDALWLLLQRTELDGVPAKIVIAIGGAAFMGVSSIVPLRTLRAVTCPGGHLDRLGAFHEATTLADETVSSSPGGSR